MSSMLTPTQRYAAGGLLGLALYQAQINQTNPLCSISDDQSDGLDKISSNDSNSQLWIHHSSDLLRPIFAFFDIEEKSWPGLEETYGTDSAKRAATVFLRLLADESDDTSKEAKEQEIALSKAVDAMASNIGKSVDYESKKEKHQEYEDECRDKFSCDVQSQIATEHKDLQVEVDKKGKQSSVEVAPIGTGSKFDDKPFDEVSVINYQKKVVVLYELLSACLAIPPESDSKSGRRNGYDARHRVALHLLAAWLNVNWLIMKHRCMNFAKAMEESLEAEAIETIIACSAMAILKEEERKEEEVHSPSSPWNNWKRGSIIGAAALTGGTLMAITGGLAAPGIAAGFGALAPTLGHVIGITGFHAAANATATHAAATAAAHAAATAAATHAAVAASFGAAGAGLSGMKMAKRIGDIDEFEFKNVGENHNQGRLAVEILVSGFVFEEEDYVRPWEGQANNSERYALQWESKNLIAVSTAIQDWLTSQLALEMMKHGATLTVLHTLLSALAWPTALLNIIDLIDSKWAIAIDRSDKAGILLAEEVLLKGLQGHRPVTLIGFSLGARVIFKCLQVLAEAECNAGLVEKVVLLGSPVSIKDEKWEDARKVVAGRFVNAYSQNDWMLAVVFRANLLSQGLAGIQAVDTPGIENVDVGQFIEGHSSYLWATQRIMEKLQLDAYFAASNADIAEPSTAVSVQSPVASPVAISPTKIINLFRKSRDV